ncbi:MAG: MarR family winged helix-turn-helix transcriptional regulator [Lachnospiraceae bacterium]|nr:MarR family winged helix-turn-helix transcriptional regulator [Lachnospiraceae bacterium]
MSIYDKLINEIRKFNRFYTVNMGFLDSSYLDSNYSIAETRILFEIKVHGTCIQSDIVKTLHIDKSYLSRLVQRFCKKGLVEKIKSNDDKRMTKITLTERGIEETERLIALTNKQIESQIKELDFDECDKLCNALNTIISILGKERC